MILLKILIGIFYIVFSFNNCFAFQAKLDKTTILMDTDFSGDSINITGVNEEGEVFIVFKSKKVNFKIYNKEKILGTWQNTKPYLFKDVYKFYGIYTEQNSTLIEEDILKDLEIGMMNLNFDHFVTNESEESFSCEASRDTFLDHEKKAQRFKEHYAEIKTNENSKFEVKIEVPDHIKPGEYSIEIFSIDNKELKNFAIFHIKIKRAGFLLTLKEMSRNYKVLYSFTVILISFVIGLFSFYLTKLFYYNKK
jgi:hypothetical protein